MSDHADRVTITIEAGVADVRMVRTDKMNALDEAMFEALVTAGERLKSEKGVRAAVLSGEGRAFCAGIDTGNLKRRAENGGGTLLSHGFAPRTHGLANRSQYAAWVWREVPVPVIAAVHGVAFGGGLQIALGCDMRFVTPDARLSVMELKWGLVPDMSGTQTLVGLAREDVIRDLVYTARIVSGEEALALGLATRVCADPRAEALAAAREIAGKNPHAIRAAKRLINEAALAGPAKGLLAESVEEDALAGSPNQVEAVKANFENRPPAFIDP
ncbi:MAG: crotonase/enoyl-CoA hydratase family protein [Caulobacteraceae bacterium]|nr:crotonase/enoyl-CoA hydratase family protein [Caulobacteraceae bacterium]